MPPPPATSTHTATATHTATSTFTATPTGTPRFPRSSSTLLDVTTTCCSPRWARAGVHLIVHGNPVTVRATFRFFLGDHRFNLEMAPTDGSALDGAACYGPGMLSVRTFSTAGEDIVETGNILASCPTGEYQVIVHQADGASARGVDRPIFVPTKVVRQTPPTFTAMVAVGGTRAVNLSAVGAEYDAFVYRISGGGIVSEWLPLEDTVQIPPVFGSDITIEARGCIFDTDGDCPVDGPIASAQLTLPALSDPSDEPNLNPVFRLPHGASTLIPDWDAPPAGYQFDGYDYFLWDVNRELAAGHSGLLRRAGAADPPSEIYLGGLRPASYYQFCVRAYQEDNFGATEYQCVDGFTAPTNTKAPPPVNVLFLECFNDRVTASWHPPLILPGDPLLVRFDYTWTGTLAGSGLPTASQTGMVTALHPIQLIYSAQTDIFAAGDAVDFSVSAIYQVGTEPDGYSFYTSEVTRIGGAACTVPHLTEPTADLWLMLGGIRNDVGVVVPVGAEVDLMWRTTGANDGATLIQDGSITLSTDLINLLGLTQNSAAGVTRDYVLSARNTDGITAVDSISITWQTEDDPIWDRTVTVILIIKDIPPPTLMVVCANGALTASWTIDIAAGLTLTGFAYSVIVAEVDEIGEIEGVLGPDARSISIPGSAEVITFVINAVYTGADGTTGLQSPAPRPPADCPVPPPTSPWTACPAPAPPPSPPRAGRRRRRSPDSPSSATSTPGTSTTS